MKKIVRGIVAVLCCGFVVALAINLLSAGNAPATWAGVVVCLFLGWVVYQFAVAFWRSYRG